MLGSVLYSAQTVIGRTVLRRVRHDWDEASIARRQGGKLQSMGEINASSSGMPSQRPESLQSMGELQVLNSSGRSQTSCRRAGNGELDVCHKCGATADVQDVGLKTTLESTFLLDNLGTVLCKGHTQLAPSLVGTCCAT